MGIFGRLAKLDRALDVVLLNGGRNNPRGRLFTALGGDLFADGGRGGGGERAGGWVDG